MFFVFLLVSKLSARRENNFHFLIVICDEINKLNWIELNWIELNWIESSSEERCCGSHHDACVNLDLILMILFWQMIKLL